MALPDGDAVRQFDTVLLVFSDGSRQFAEVHGDSWVRVRKAGFPATELLGAAYGAVFEIGAPKAGRRAALTPVADGALVPAIQLDLGSGADNRALVDTSDAQSLGAAEIARMRAEGAGGGAIIAALAGGSSTFASKTAFSQEKWLRKKALKYLPRFRVVRTTPLNVCETALLKHADKVAGLRADALARMLNAGDVRAGSLPLVIDGVSGLLLAAVVHRMGGAGTLLAAHADGPGGPQLGYLSKLNFGSGGGGGGASALTIVGVTFGMMARVARDAAAVATRLLAVDAVATSAVAGTSTSFGTGAGASVQADAPPASDTAAPAIDAVVGSNGGAPADGSTAAVVARETMQSADDAASGGAASLAAAVAATDVDGSPSGSPTAVVAGVVAGVVAAAATPATGEVAVAAPAAAAAAAPGVGGHKRPRGGGDGSGGGGRSSGNGGGAAAANPHIVRPARVTDDERAALLLRGADSCLIATHADPLPLLMLAARFLRPSSAVAAYSTEAEPLARAARALRAAGLAVTVDISETWTREYQVLPARTHPTMSMHGASGFLLTAVTVATVYSVVEPPML